jgi:hypothetical protein
MIGATILDGDRPFWSRELQNKARENLRPGNSKKIGSELRGGN